jgi:hypothetical protein
MKLYRIIEYFRCQFDRVHLTRIQKDYVDFSVKLWLTLDGYVTVLNGGERFKFFICDWLVEKTIYVGKNELLASNTSNVLK